MSDSNAITVLADGTVPLGGVYANMVKVWHTRYEFTVEFAVSLPHGLTEANAVSVARLKVPPEIAWQLAKDIAADVDQFEKEHYSLTPPPTD